MPQINLRNPVTLRVHKKGSGKDGKGVEFAEIHLPRGLQNVDQEIADHPYIKDCMADKPKVNPAVTQAARAAAEKLSPEEQRKQELAREAAKRDPNEHPAQRQAPAQEGGPAPIRDRQ
jgi:hypothetical protein